MTIFISILIIIASALLILIILIQNPKGGGISSNFMSSNQVFGARQQVELVEQITWGFAIGIVVLCIAGTAFQSGISENNGHTKESVVSTTEMPVPGSGIPTMLPDTTKK